LRDRRSGLLAEIPVHCAALYFADRHCAIVGPRG
jgi:hypothetical protein